MDEPVLTEVRKLLRENILPRLDNLDASLHELREATWPVCQGLRDQAAGGPLTNIQTKARFFKFLHIEDIRALLTKKAVSMGIYSKEVVDEELRQILVTS